MNYQNRITPPYIDQLESNEIFVFGSNLHGIHGKGAAKTALKFGAIYNKAIGIQGQTYAIPTKNYNITDALPLYEILKYINDFIYYLKNYPDKIFLITPIGCGLAGYNESDIAPLFREVINIEKCLFTIRILESIN